MKYYFKINITINSEYFIKSVQHIIKEYLTEYDFFKEVSLLDLFIDNYNAYTYHIETKYDLKDVSNYITIYLIEIEKKIKRMYVEFGNNWKLNYDLVED